MSIEKIASIANVNVFKSESKHAVVSKHTPVVDKITSESVVQLSDLAKTTSPQNMARLEEIANQIKNKTFQVNPEAIAQKMLSDKDTIKLLLES